MKIGKLALATQTAVETIRCYGREGLLARAPRSGGNYRIYGPEQVERLVFVRHCRSLDVTLNEICVLLRFRDEPQAGCGEVNALLDEHIGHVAARIEELRRLKRQLKVLRERCAGVREAARCGILDGLAQPVAPTGAQSTGAPVPSSRGGRGRPSRASSTTDRSEPRAGGRTAPGADRTSADRPTGRRRAVNRGI